jgi:3-isopropylmalate/(R)-2-methylmalate dehydratase large subunit
MSTSIRKRGSFLVLTADADQTQSQLTGHRFTAEQAVEQSLHYGVNTDAMISGQACTLGYTGEILGPYFLENFQEVVKLDSIRKNDFQIVVGGDAYGTGSSREVAVVAHQGAGIELVVAKSFQRIFQENMVYSGLPFTSDFSVLNRLENGEAIELSELYAALPPFFHTVATSGGLLPFANLWLSGNVHPWYDIQTPSQGMTVVEKLVARRTWKSGTLGDDALSFGIPSVSPGDQVLCSVAFRGMHEYTAGMCMALYKEAFGITPVNNPEQVAAFEDHFVLIDEPSVPAHTKKARLSAARKLASEMTEACDEFGLRLHGPGRNQDAGVCHRIVVEQYASPGDIVVLTDSHTPTSGVLNTFAFGVGSTAMTFALRTGLIPVTVPKTVRVVITGDAKGILSPKDLILHIIGDAYFREEHWRNTPTDTCVIQFGGAGLNQWNVDELSVLTNMTVEGGLMTGVVEPCEPILRFMAEHRTGWSEDTALHDSLVYPDADAHYERVIEIDLDEVPLTVATPGDSRNRASLEDVSDIAIQNVVIASCTGGSLADLRAAARILKGNQLHESVRLTVTPSSTLVSHQAKKEGLMDIFASVGAVISPPGCGSCIGNGPGIPLPDETTASTTNRNYDRRMGAPGPVYLVSPAVAAASAITGRLTDPRVLP